MATTDKNKINDPSNTKIWFISDLWFGNNQKGQTMSEKYHGRIWRGMDFWNNVNIIVSQGFCEIPIWPYLYSLNPLF